MLVSREIFEETDTGRFFDVWCFGWGHARRVQLTADPELGNRPRRYYPREAVAP